jgi:hypothetical protein
VCLGLLCVDQGCCEFAAAKQQNVPCTKNILLLVNGDVPPGEVAGATGAYPCIASVHLVHFFCN